MFQEDVFFFSWCVSGLLIVFHIKTNPPIHVLALTYSSSFPTLHPLPCSLRFRESNCLFIQSRFFLSSSGKTPNLVVLLWVYSSLILPFLNCRAPKPHAVPQTMSQQDPMQQVAHFCKTWPVPSTLSVTSCWQFRDPTITQLHPPALQITCSHWEEKIFCWSTTSHR